MFDIHQFFARLAWLNEPASTAEPAQLQLNQFLYGPTPFWSAAASLGSGNYSELGALFDTVPEALRLWMVQFKRGARVVGGMVLPRLKADFADAAFSVTYLKNYGAGA